MLKMVKNFLTDSFKILICALGVISALYIDGFSEVHISTYVVDGVHNNPEVVIYNRQPVFSWDYSGIISSFTIKVGTATAPATEYILATSTVWVIHTTTSSTDVSLLNLGDSNFRATIEYAGSPLQVKTKYHWALIATSTEGVSTSVLGNFYTIVSSVTLSPTADYDLQVDWNNPFNPDEGQVTKFRYILKGTKDIKRNVRVRIYTLAGEYVTTAKHYAPLSDDPNWYDALPNREYTAEWDGKDIHGEIIPAGLYLVNLTVNGESKGVTKIVIVKRNK